MAVIFAFLRSSQTTIIPALTFPTALVDTGAAIWLAVFSVNKISVLALAIATGMLVDGHIVAIENMVPERKESIGANAATASGTNELFFAVISTTAIQPMLRRSPRYSSCLVRRPGVQRV